tara:strand:+ start:141 stop:827 length:687 start_codon:yes stop_codon:yes gene_type:complete
MMSVVQNFICTQSDRLALIEREVPKMSMVFKDYDFFINYGILDNYFQVSDVYNVNVQKLNFFNNLTSNWGEVTLELIEKVKTPYTLILCEDFDYRITNNDWVEIMNEVVERDVSYMPIGRLWKYTQEQYHGGYEEGNKLWLYPASKSPGSSLSVDALYKTDMLKEKLIELKQHGPNRFPLNLPHHYEDIFQENYNNGVRKWGDDVLCAVPKDIIIMHEQPSTETTLNK